MRVEREIRMWKLKCWEVIDDFTILIIIYY